LIFAANCETNASRLFRNIYPALKASASLTVSWSIFSFAFSNRSRIGPIEASLLHLGPDVLVFVNSAKLLHVRIDGV
jgi:hypothetical protein